MYATVLTSEKLANSNLMQVYIESLIQFGLTSPNYWHCWTRPVHLELDRPIDRGLLWLNPVFLWLSYKMIF